MFMSLTRYFNVLLSIKISEYLEKAPSQALKAEVYIFKLLAVTVQQLKTQPEEILDDLNMLLYHLTGDSFKCCNCDWF